MTLQQVPKQVELFVRKNSTSILTGLGVSGVVATGYLAHQAGMRTAHGLSEEDPWMSNKEKARIVWRHYIPVTITGVVTIGCVIGATRIGNRRTAALAAAYSLSERAFTEYKEKVVEKLGERKEQGIRDDIAQDKVGANPPGREVMVVGAGTVLCCESHTGRYFLSDMETLKKAQNDINFRILNHDYATLADFYHFIGLSPTASSSDFGWTSDKKFELSFSTVLAEESRPCLAFEYNYLKML